MTETHSPVLHATPGPVPTELELNNMSNTETSLDEHHPALQDDEKTLTGRATADEKEAMASATRDSPEPEPTAPPPLASMEKQVPAGEDEEEAADYPKGMKLVLIMVSLFLAMFLVALDRTIIATAIPKITDDFKSLGDIGWYGSAYMLTSCAFQLFFGKVYTFYSTKVVFLIAIGLFEVGSALCGAAPTSMAFILGRAIAGLGSAGIFSGVVVVMVHSVPLHKRPAYQGGFGAVFGLASVVGPLLGGAFTTKSTWRWCFYINLPIGAVSVLVIAFILKLSPPEEGGKTLKEQINQLDPIGTLFFLPGVICLLLALQWGGSTYPWSSARIIVLLILAFLLLTAFIGVQIWKQDGATVPPRILSQRSVASGFTYAALSGSAMMIFVYFIPIWFQAILGTTAFSSGIKMLPLVLALVVGSGASGGVTSGTGYYTPALILGTVIMSIGAGLMTTWNVNTKEGMWIGYQILFGFGLGCSMQIPGMAAQTVLSNKDVPIGASLMFFAQWLGGSIFISVGQNVLSNKLTQGFKNIGGGFDGSLVNHFGATDLRNAVPEQYLPQVLKVYNSALMKVFVVAVALVVATIVPALTMEWMSVKKDLVKKGEEEGGVEAN